MLCWWYINTQNQDISTQTLYNAVCVIFQHLVSGENICFVLEKQFYHTNVSSLQWQCCDGFLKITTSVFLRSPQLQYVWGCDRPPSPGWNPLQIWATSCFSFFLSFFYRFEKHCDILTAPVFTIITVIVILTTIMAFRYIPTMTIKYVIITVINWNNHQHHPIIIIITETHLEHCSPLASSILEAICYVNARTHYMYLISLMVCLYRFLHTRDECTK